jgi:hypothetical protein
MAIDIILLSALVVGLVEMIKLVGKEKVKRYLPLIAVLLGLGISFLLSLYSSTAEMIVRGIIIGLSAAGLWDNVKYPIEKLRK